jgi:CheY-like chemotaxis protein
MPVERHAPASESNHLRQPRILYAEDNPSLRFCLSERLRLAGYEVTAAEDGEQAWIALQAGSYDLLITDNQMPGISGAELILRLRRRDRALPIIVVSSDLEFFTESRCQLLQIAAVVPKPFSLGQLCHAVGRVFCADHNVGWGRRAASGPVTECPPRHAAPEISFDLPDAIHSNSAATCPQ